jgi:hypothetical protein
MDVVNEMKVKTYDIWYKTRDHLTHETESLSGTWNQLLNRLTEMGLDKKVILAIGEGGVFRPYRLSSGEV